MNKMDAASRHGLHCTKPIVSRGKPIQASLSRSICRVSYCLAKSGSRLRRIIGPFKWKVYREIFTPCVVYADVRNK